MRAAIGVGSTPFNDGNVHVEMALMGDVMFSQKPRLEALLQNEYAAPSGSGGGLKIKTFFFFSKNRGKCLHVFVFTLRFKVLIYNGALDLICGGPLTERYLPLLDWQGASEWPQTPRTLWMDPVAFILQCFIVCWLV